MKDFTDEFSALRGRLGEVQRYLNIDAARRRVDELQGEVSKPDLWDKPDVARVVTTELNRLTEDINLIEDLSSQLSDAETLYELGVNEDDPSVESEIVDGLAKLSQRLDDLDLRSLLNGEHDEYDAVCEIHSGAGGTDSQDWAEMMLRMYTRWVERRGFTMELDELSEGQEAGIISATFIVRGRYAYGLLLSEQGVHRLVRISPFDSQSRRHTSFASFDAIPFIDEPSEETEIEEKDLRIDTYRSSGAGGQHVNVTDSAVRITHLPTGIVVACQNQRSQHQNKAKAMQILAAKLSEHERRARQAEMDAISGEKQEVGWGSQIRSYVLAPYQKVKDERTKFETGNVEAVLDGDLDPFIAATLRWKRSQGALKSSKN